MRTSWWAARVQESQGKPGHPNPRMFRVFQLTIGAYIRLFHRPRLQGAQRLVRDGPYLLVANHSAGLAMGEIASFALCYAKQVGADRPLAGLAHPFGFFTWPISTMLRGLGAIPSTYAAAAAAVGQGVPVLVFPGGDYEASRPIWKANEVDFNGRKGFLRIAREHKLPIIPMGIRGSHYSVPILWRSEWLLPRLFVIPILFGVKRFPLTLMSVVGAVLIVTLAGPVIGWHWAALLAFAYASSPLVFLPTIPSTIRMRVGQAIPWEDLFAVEPDDTEDEVLQRAYHRVVGEVQGLVDQGKRGA